MNYILKRNNFTMNMYKGKAIFFKRYFSKEDWGPVVHSGKLFAHTHFLFFSLSCLNFPLASLDNLLNTLLAPKFFPQGLFIWGNITVQSREYSYKCNDHKIQPALLFCKFLVILKPHFDAFICNSYGAFFRVERSERILFSKFVR